MKNDHIIIKEMSFLNKKGKKNKKYHPIALFGKDLKHLETSNFYLFKKEWVFFVIDKKIYEPNQLKYDRSCDRV